MAVIHRGATITPHFRDFLPAWVERQPWYRGAGRPALTPVGYFRFTDPAGVVGVETHLVTDGSCLYQIPLTYRGAPAAGEPGAQALIATTEHSVLGTRWIYDATADPVWAGEVLRIVRIGGASDPSLKPGTGPAQARGYRTGAWEANGDQDRPRPGEVTLDLIRVVEPGDPPGEAGLAGHVMGTWHPAGPESAPERGCLLLVRAASSGDREGGRR